MGLPGQTHDLGAKGQAVGEVRVVDRCTVAPSPSIVTDPPSCLESRRYTPPGPTAMWSTFAFSCPDGRSCRAIHPSRSSSRRTFALASSPQAPICQFSIQPGGLRNAMIQSASAEPPKVPKVQPAPGQCCAAAKERMRTLPHRRPSRRTACACADARTGRARRTCSELACRQCCPPWSLPVGELGRRCDRGEVAAGVATDCSGRGDVDPGPRQAAGDRDELGHVHQSLGPRFGDQGSRRPC